jgi:2-phosphosulfolactate phosphatase
VSIDVLFGVSGLAAGELAGKVVAVIDVLRASTSIATALANGARAVIPFESSEGVIDRAKAYERGDVLLAGERRMLPIAGFDLGNSPLEFTSAAVEGKTVLMATTNGTAAIVAAQGARDVIVGSYVNFTATLSMLRAALRGGADIAIICAGRERQFALEDAACAGRFANQLTKRQSGATLNDGASACVLIDRKYGDNLIAMFDASEHGRALRAAGFGDDLTACAEIDGCPVIPVYQDRQITKVGPDRAR